MVKDYQNSLSTVRIQCIMRFQYIFQRIKEFDYIQNLQIEIEKECGILEQFISL